MAFLRSTRCLNRHNAFLFLFFFFLVDQRPLSSRATRFSRIRGKRTNDESWKDVITSGWRALLEERARKLYHWIFLITLRSSLSNKFPDIDSSKKNIPSIILCELHGESSSQWMISPSGKVSRSRMTTVINISNSTENLPSRLLLLPLKSDSPLIPNSKKKKKNGDGIFDVSTKRYLREALIPRQLRDPRLIHALYIADDKRSLLKSVDENKWIKKKKEGDEAKNKYTNVN